MRSAALLVGGVIAAPIAAWLVRHIPGRILGSLVGGVIVLTNARTILRSDQVDALGLDPGDRVRPDRGGLGGAVAWSVRSHRAERAEIAGRGSRSSRQRP